MPVDPVTAGPILHKVWTYGYALYTFIQDNQTIGQDIRNLHSQAGAIRGTIELFQSRLQNDEVAPYYDAKIWDGAYKALQKAQAVMTQLDKELKPLQVSHQKGWTLRDPKRVLTKQSLIPTIDILTNQLGTHLTYLREIQDRINMHISNMRQIAAQEQLTRVEEMVGEMLLAMRATSQTPRPRGWSLGDIASKFETRRNIHLRVTSLPRDSASSDPITLNTSALLDPVVSVPMFDAFEVFEEEEPVPTDQPVVEKQNDISRPRRNSSVKMTLIRAQSSIWRWPPLHYSLYKGFISFIPSLLAENQDSVHQKIGRDQDGVLHIASRYCPEALRLLLKIDRINVNATNLRGQTPLHVAVRYSPLAVTELLGHDADPNVRDVAAWTPLHYASTAEAVDLLFKFSARLLPDDSTDTPIWSPMQTAALALKPAVLKALIEHGVPVNTPPGSPSPLALVFNHWFKFTWSIPAECRRLLLAAGASTNVSCADNGKEGPFLLLQKYSPFKDMVSILLEHGANLQQAIELSQSQKDDTSLTGMERAEAAQNLSRLQALAQRRGKGS